MVSVNLKSSDWKHLVWILYAGAMLLALPLFFIQLLNIPLDYYYLIFLAGTIAFVVIYRRYSSFKIRSSLKTGWALGFILAVFVGFGFVSISLSDSLRFSVFLSRLSEPGVLWRGIAFGLAGGIMISTLPFVVVWRSLAGQNPGGLRKIAVVLAASVSIVLLSFCHNLGLTGFKNINSQIQKNVVAGLPTLFSGNPLAAALAGTFMSVSEAAKSENTEVPESTGKTVIATNSGQIGGAN